MSPRISVVVATYNYGKYLPRALDSVLLQERADVEVFVVDDGSSDQTEAVVGQYGSDVHYIRQPHQGTFAACRTGVLASTGKWILFVDADDRLEPGAISALRAAASANPDAGLIVGRTRSVSVGGQETVHDHPPLSSDPLANFERFASGRLHFSIAGGLVHRSLLMQFDRESFDYPHSMDLAILGTGLLRGVVQIDRVTLDVFDHAGRLRDNIASIHSSGLKLVDVLFDPALLAPAAMRYRRAFLGRIELERTRSYYRVGWYSLSWRSYLRAVAASPGALTSGRNLRRAAISVWRSLLCVDEGPVRRVPGHRLFGHHARLRTDAVQFVAECARSYGPVARLRLHRPTYLLAASEDAIHVLVANPTNYHKAGILRDDPVLANGMIGMEGPRHAEHRRIFAAGFRRQSVGEFAPLIVGVIDRHVDRWGSGQSVDSVSAIKAMLSEIAGRVVFGCEDPELTDRLLQLLREAHLCSCREALAFVRWPRWVPLNRRRRHSRVRRELDRWLEPVLAARMKQPSDDLLSTMLASWNEPRPPTVAALRDPLMMLFLAFCEPVLAALAWSLQVLARDSRMQQAVARELESIDARLPGVDDMPKLTFTQNLVAEVLRMYPSEWLMTRTAQADDRLPSGLLVRRGRQVMISSYALGRNARHFLNPEQFDPDRFVGSPSWPRGAYIPFGAGPRGCIGEFFARLQLTLSLALIVRRYRIETVADDYPAVVSENLFTLQPPDGQSVFRFRRRETA